MANTHGPETEWVAETDASAVAPGDRIRLTDRQDSYEFYVDAMNEADGGVWFSSERRSFYWTPGQKLQIRRPVVVLPTSAGSVIRWRNEVGGDHLLVLDDSGNWGSRGYEVGASAIKKFTVVSRPGFEVAEEVLKAIQRIRVLGRAGQKALEVVAQRYGVDL